MRAFNCTFLQRSHVDVGHFELNRNTGQLSFVDHVSTFGLLKAFGRARFFFVELFLALEVGRKEFHLTLQFEVSLLQLNDFRMFDNQQHLAFLHHHAIQDLDFFDVTAKRHGDVRFILRRHIDDAIGKNTQAHLLCAERTKLDPEGLHLLGR